MATLITTKQHKKDWLAYCRTTGATDKKELFEFVQGCYDLGIWDNMVCWPLRSGQQAITGTTVHSLGGLGSYNGNIQSVPVMGADGTVFDGVDDHIALEADFATIDGANPTFAMGGVLVSVLDGSHGTILSSSALSNRPYVRRLGFMGSGGPELDYAAIYSAPNWFAGSRNSARLQQLYLGGQTMANTNSQTADDVYSGPMTIGRRAEVHLSGTCSFAFFISHDIDYSAINAQLYALYKSTLGQGLGLI